jgi:predicted HTH transcriptional regulator
VIYPTHALVLFSDDPLRNTLFHYAKVECARFKGVNSEEFIDQKSIRSNIAMQAEEAYNFVLRHINKGAVVEGVYTLSRWEYPIKAIREVIRNAVVHRDYSLTGKDIKVAIYDDMVEITSPGLLPPSIDYGAMDSRQSDAKNKTIAPVFKLLGIIDQWGNGLKMISDELKEYPTIEFRWKEVGLSFQVQFVKLNYIAEQQQQKEIGQELRQELGQELRQELGQELGQEQKEKTLFSLILKQLQTQPQSRKYLKEVFGLKKVSGYLNRTLTKLQSHNLIAQTIPDNPNHPGQKFRITERGIIFISLIKQK